MPGYVGSILFIQLLGLGQIFSSPASVDSSVVHFKTDWDEGVPRSVPEISPCPDGQDFCEDPEDYPQVVTRFASFTNRNVFNASVGLRSNFVQESRACDVRKSTIYPRKAKDLAGTFKFILNSDEYIQSLDIEECIGEGSLCRVDSDAPIAGSTRCRQKYAKYQLLAIDKDGNDIVDFFRLPSACICHHSKGSSNGASGVELRFNVKNNEPSLPICTGKGINAVGGGKAENSESLSVPQSGGNLENAQGVGIKNQDDSKITFIDDSPPENTRSYRHTLHRNHPASYYGRRQARDLTFSDDSKITFKEEPQIENRRSYRQTTRKNHPTSQRRRQSRGLMAQGCSGRKYCEGSDSYPAQLIENIVETESKIPSRILNKFIKRACVEQSDLVFTRQFNINEEQLCQGFRRIITPKEALNIKNEWKYIVNSVNYTQTVDIEECARPGNGRGGIEIESQKLEDFGSCLYSGLQGSNPEQTSCRQLYREHKLLVVTQNGELEIDKFSLPSACACFLRSEFPSLEFRNAH